MTRQVNAKSGAGQKAFKASLAEGLKFAQGKKAKVKVETLMIRTGPQDIKDARKALHATQPQFARLLQVSPESVKKWEQGVNPIPGAVSRWIQAALLHPKTVGNILSEISAAR